MNCLPAAWLSKLVAEKPHMPHLQQSTARDGLECGNQLGVQVPYQAYADQSQAHSSHQVVQPVHVTEVQIHTDIPATRHLRAGSEDDVVVVQGGQKGLQVSIEGGAGVNRSEGKIGGGGGGEEVMVEGGGAEDMPVNMEEASQHLQL